MTYFALKTANFAHKKNRKKTIWFWFTISGLNSVLIPLETYATRTFSFKEKVLVMTLVTVRLFDEEKTKLTCSMRPFRSSNTAKLL